MRRAVFLVLFASLALAEPIEPPAEDTIFETSMWNLSSFGAYEDSALGTMMVFEERFVEDRFVRYDVVYLDTAQTQDLYSVRYEADQSFDITFLGLVRTDILRTVVFNITNDVGDNSWTNKIEVLDYLDGGWTPSQTWELESWPGDLPKYKVLWDVSTPVQVDGKVALAFIEPNPAFDERRDIYWVADVTDPQPLLLRTAPADELLRGIYAFVDQDGGPHVMVRRANQPIEAWHATDSGWVSQLIPNSTTLLGPWGMSTTPSGPLTVVLKDVQDAELYFEFTGAEWVLGGQWLEGTGRRVQAVSMDADGRTITQAWEPDGTQTIIYRDGGLESSWVPEASEQLAIADDHAIIKAVWDGAGYQVQGMRVDGGPIARITMPTEAATTRRSGSFQDDSVIPSGNLVASVTWDFAGAIKSGDAVDHTFAAAGRNYVTMRVVDQHGLNDTAHGFVDIAQIGPTACLQSASSATTNIAVSLTDCTTHAESDLGANWASEFDFGDGTTSNATTHTYTSPGTYTITLTVTDEQGATDTASKTITVTNPPPNQKPSVTVSFTPEAPVAGQEVTFTATASDSDGSIASKAWSIDGTAAGTGNMLTQTFTEAGVVSVAFTATDDDGASTTVTKSVNVQAPTAPEISLSQTQITDKSGQAFTIDVTVTNPNPVPVAVNLSSDAPEAWSPAFDESTFELAAGESKNIGYTITPPYTVGGLTLISIEASIGDATNTAILRAQFTVGEAPDDPVEDPVDDGTDDSEPVTNIEQKATDSKSGVPTWAWFAGGGAALLAGVGVTLAVVLRKP